MGDRRYIMIIIFNGVSSSGKSSIASEILKISEIIFLYFNVDFLVPSLLPHEDSFLPAENVTVNFERSYIRKLNVDLFQRLSKSGLSLPLYEYIPILHKQKLNIIVDTIIFDIDNFIKYFDVEQTFFIKIDCTIEELIKREKNRKDRKKGNALKQKELFHKNNFYDFEIETTDNTPLKCAKLVLDYVKNNKPFALKEMNKSI